MTSPRFTQPIAYPDYSTSEDYSLLIFDITKLNEEWKKNSWIHFKPENLLPQNLRPMEQRLRTNQPFAMPVIRISEGVDAGTQCLDICDGRKRTAFFLSKGVTKLPAMVETIQRDEIIAMGIARLPTPQERQALNNEMPFPQPNTRPVGS